jgi:hypothetical protein
VDISKVKPSTYQSMFTKEELLEDRNGEVSKHTDKRPEANETQRARDLSYNGYYNIFME